MYTLSWEVALCSVVLFHFFLWCTELESDGSSTFTPVHVLNIDIKDNHEEATLGAFLFLELCEMVREASSPIHHLIPGPQNVKTLRIISSLIFPNHTP